MGENLEAMETIVVGYDDTEPAKRALTRAAELARILDARLVVTAVAPVEEAAGNPDVTAGDLDLPELAHARALLEEAGVEAEYKTALGEPADAIVEVAERTGADLIVLGTREPGVVDRLLGHSVSHGVLRKASCDVLVVRR
jgi:nucleotide-binding universal stress UspA family protein